MKNRKVLRPKEAAKKLGVARPTLYLWMKREGFPKKVALGPRASGLYEDELDAWLEQQAGVLKIGREAKPGRPPTTKHEMPIESRAHSEVERSETSAASRDQWSRWVKLKDGHYGRQGKTVDLTAVFRGEALHPPKDTSGGVKG